MIQELTPVRGTHPGKIVEKELKSRKIRKNAFAASIDEYPQTLVAVLKGKRRMNTALALKIEAALGFEEGFLLVLQVFYDIEEEKKLQRKRPPSMKIMRPVLFWDMQPESMDWQKQKRQIIKRVLELGNEAEREEIIRYYGTEQVKDVMLSLDRI
jgi:antitoxin HigA-1